MIGDMGLGAHARVWPDVGEGIHQDLVLQVEKAKMLFAGRHYRGT